MVTSSSSKAIRPIKKPPVEKTIRQEYGLSNQFLIDVMGGVYAKDLFIAGAELEIESVKTVNHDFCAREHIQRTEDGSLRNNGYEFLLPPSNKENLVRRFKEFHKSIAYRSGNDPFSFRTSTHVHVNMQESTFKQAKTLLFLYSIFEPLAFNYVGQNRRNNIHCVPLTMTIIPSLYRHDLKTMVAKWSKYTALNLMPIVELGTYEFRHLEGTNNPERFEEWVNFINTLWTIAHNVDFKSEYLIDLSFLKQVQQELLTPGFIKNCKEKPNYVLEDNLLDVKFGFLNETDTSCVDW